MTLPAETGAGSLVPQRYSASHIAPSHLRLSQMRQSQVRQSQMEPSHLRLSHLRHPALRHPDGVTPRRDPDLMALTRLEAAAPGGSVLMVCTCGARELHSTRDGARAARAAHEIRAHSLTARTSPGAWAVRKARQRARSRA